MEEVLAASGWGDPWEEFCERLKQAGHVLRREATPKDELTLAEGYRHLARLIRVGFEAAFEFADTERPVVYQSVTATTCGEGETSDARYHQAFIDGAATYRVTGHRGTAPLIEFAVYDGKIGLHDASRQVGALTEQELIVGADGSFEIVLSPEPHPGNWIRTTADAKMLYIRQYTHDWQRTRSASFAIRREPSAPDRGPVRLDEVRAALLRAATYVERASSFWAGVVDRRVAAEPNVFHEIPAAVSPDRPAMPTGHRFVAGYFRLAPEEALVVTFTAAEVPYWGLDLTNYWFEPLSYDDHLSHLNDKTVIAEPDGSVRIVIAAAPGGERNWLDTRGHAHGTMLFRWSRSEEPLPRLVTRIVKRPSALDSDSSG